MAVCAVGCQALSGATKGCAGRTRSLRGGNGGLAAALSFVHPILSTPVLENWRWSVCRPANMRGARRRRVSPLPWVRRAGRGTGAGDGRGVRRIEAPGRSRRLRRGRQIEALAGRGGRVPAGGRGRRAARCRSGGIAHPGGWTMDHRSIGADCETRRSARRRQLRRRRGESRPARGAVRPGDGPGEREGVNPARSTHAGPWFQCRRGSGTTGKRRGRRSCGQAGRPSRPPRGRRQRGIEAPTRRGRRGRRGLRGHRNWGVAIEDILR